MATYSASRTSSGSNAGIGVVVDTTQMKTLSLAMRRAPVEVRKAALLALRTTMKVIMADASARASFSPRITASMKIKGSGLYIKGVAGGGNAWIAVPIENRGEGDVVHPTFGHEPITNKNSHPAFMGPALAAHRDEALAVIEEAVYEATLKAIRGL